MVRRYTIHIYTAKTGILRHDTDGHHPTAGLSDGKNAKDTALSGTHTDSDVPAPGNLNIGSGGATSMSNSDTTHPGAQGTPAQGVAGSGGAGAGMAHSDKQQSAGSSQGSGNPEADPKDQSSGAGKDGGDEKVTPETANASGDGTFGDGKFDAKAPGAAAEAQQLEAKARQEVGEEGKINISVN